MAASLLAGDAQVHNRPLSYSLGASLLASSPNSQLVTPTGEPFQNASLRASDR